MTSPNSELVSEALRATPAVTSTGLILFGVSLSDWVLIASLLLVVLQIIFLIRDKWYRPRKARNGSKR